MSASFSTPNERKPSTDLVRWSGNDATLDELMWSPSAASGGSIFSADRSLSGAATVERRANIVASKISSSVSHTLARLARRIEMKTGQFEVERDRTGTLVLPRPRDDTEIFRAANNLLWNLRA
jgi:hypothetical protein